MYRLDRLLNWRNRVGEKLIEDDWLDLLDDFGPVLLRFLLDETKLEEIPEGDPSLKAFKKSIQRQRLSGLKPERGAVWILFARKGALSGLPNCFRRDGFLLPFVWRRVENNEVDHSGLLPQKLVLLSEQVRRQFGEKAQGFSLQPAGYFAGQVDFSMDETGFVSAWGALASGLYFALNVKAALTAWPFSSIAFDFERNEPSAVGELEAKFSLAASFGANEFAVAPNQLIDAKKRLKALQKADRDNCQLRRMSIYPWRWTGDIETSARGLVRCNQFSVRRRFWLALAVNLGLLLILTALGIWYWWDWNLEKIHYYADYVDKFGVPVGQQKLEPGQLVGRGQSYRFHYRGYDGIFPWNRRSVLRAVYCVNSFNRPRYDQSDRPLHPSVAGRRFVYDSRFRLARVEHLEASGRVKMVYRYSGRNLENVDIVRRGYDGRLGTVPTPIVNLVSKSEMISRYRLKRDEDGCVIRMDFLRNALGALAKDEFGCSRVDYRRDVMGRIVGERHLSWEGCEACGSRGWSERRFSYGPEGEIEEIVQLKNGDEIGREKYAYENGNCVSVRRTAHGSFASRRKWFEKRMQYDDAGECKQMEFLNAEGDLVECSDSKVTRKTEFVGGCLVRSDESYFNGDGKMGHRDGCSRRVRSYNADMQVTEEVRYGMDGKLLRDDGKAAIVRTEYDADGREIERAMFDADNHLWQNPATGIAMRRRSFSQRDGELVRCCRYFDQNGAPTRGDVGGIQEEVAFDESGRVVWLRMLDGEGMPMLGKNGFHLERFSYDRLRWLSEIAFYGIKGERILARDMTPGGSAVAGMRMQCDEVGRVMRQTVYGVNGKAMECAEGWATVARTYDAAGRIAEVRLYGADGKPKAPRNGMNWRTQYSYDEDGKIARDICFALNGNYVVREYNVQGKVARKASFSADGAPCADENGVHAYVFKFDGEGREIKRGFLNVHEKPMLNEKRIAGVVTSYDDLGAIREESYFDERGNLTKDENGVCMIRWQFDEKHRNTGRQFFDEQTNRIENIFGIAAVCRVYDEYDNLIEEYDLNGEGTPIADKYGVNICHKSFDVDHHEVKRLFLDAHRKPILSKEDIAGWSSEYDNAGNEVRRIFLGLDGRPRKRSDGCAGWMEEYDDRHNVVKHVDLDLEGHPFPGTDGIAGRIIAYDDQGREIGMRWLGADERPCSMLLPFGDFFPFECRVQEGQTFYDDRGRKTMCTTLEKPCGEVAKIIFEKDLEGNDVEVKLCDGHGNLVAGSNGVARIHRVYNHLHEEIERTYWGIDEEPAELDGIHKVTSDFLRTRKGLVIDARCYDKDGNLAARSSDGVARRHIEFDLAHRIVAEETYGVSGRLVCPRGESCAQTRVKYDNKGRWVFLSQLDAEGHGTFCNGKVAEMQFKYPAPGQQSDKVEVVLFDEKSRRFHAGFIDASDPLFDFIQKNMVNLNYKSYKARVMRNEKFELVK